VAQGSLLETIIKSSLLGLFAGIKGEGLLCSSSGGFALGLRPRNFSAESSEFPFCE